MQRNYPYLADKDFLKTFDNDRLKEQYVKITVLDFLEKPIQEIQGIVTGGNLNLDGKSSVRRSCNLTLVAIEKENDLTNINNLLSINKKIKLEIGFKNNFDKYTNYKIIWFPLGTYLIISPSISHGLSDVTISLQLKDKMCLLNGECGGVLTSSVTFHEYEEKDESTGEYVIKNPTIVQIITELVNHFGNESLNNILISDLESRIKKVIKWSGGSSLYIASYLDDNTDTAEYMAFASETAAQEFVEDVNTRLQNNSGKYQEYKNGQDIGYIYTDFTYPGELIGDIGSSVCDILDKIKNLLGNYEYYYDLNGVFRFQEIKNYLNTSHSKVILDKIELGDYSVDRGMGKTVYDFKDATLINSFQNTPQFPMIKNDFLVWGLRENANGNTFPIRYHLAIDDKPEVGNVYTCIFYIDEEDQNKKAILPTFISEIKSYNGIEGKYYMSINENNDIIVYIYNNGKMEPQNSLFTKNIKTKDWREELYFQGLEAENLGLDTNYYYTELKSEWPKLYDIENQVWYNNQASDIDYFLDFIDSTNEKISSISIPSIGRRSKAINDNDINCIFELDIPNLYILKTGESNEEIINNGNNYIYLDDNFYSMVATGGTSNSAFNAIKDLLYQHTSYNETITISAIPIYYLEPNSRISVFDPEAGISGDYMINSISIPLSHSGLMSITCSRALERI